MFHVITIANFNGNLKRLHILACKYMCKYSDIKDVMLMLTFVREDVSMYLAPMDVA